MAKLSRFTQLLFGSTAGLNQMAEYGSFAASTPARYSGATITPAIIQTLSNYLQGWFAAVDGENAPTIEDMNSLCYLFAYQLCYLMQEGVPEWDSGTTYFIGSIVNDGSGNLYISQQNTNLNHAITDSAWWLAQGPQTQLFLGNGTFVCPSGVTNVHLVAQNFYGAKITFAQSSALMIDQNGNSYAWGLNNNGQIGDGSFVAKSSPVLVLGNLLFTQVADGYISGNGFSLGLDAFGSAYGWGLNGNGQLGLGNTTDFSTPVLVVGPNKFKWLGTLNPTNGCTSYGLDLGGNAYSWGYNNNGQLGDGSVVDKSSPVLVLGGFLFRSLYAAMDSTGGAVYGIDASNNLYAWGSGANGMIGDGTLVSKSSPVLVLGSLSWKLLAPPDQAGYNGIAGLTNSGDAYIWGATVARVTGNATVLSSPTIVMSGKKLVTLVSNTENGGGHPYLVGLDSSGVAWAIGSNGQGNLGDGTVTSRSTPTLVLGGIKFAQITCTQLGSVYGIDTLGQMWAWGNNSSGQLGVGDVASRSSPVLVLGGHKWVAMFKDMAAGSKIAAIDSNGQLWAWGLNSAGALGVGDVTPRSSPVLVLGGRLSNPRYPQTSYLDVPVTPGQSYAVVLGGLGSFGAIPLSLVASQLTVEYSL